MFRMNNKQLLGVMFLLICAVAAASARTRTSLNTGWKFFKADVPNAEQTRFDDSKWQRIDIPHTWNIDDPWDDEPGYYRGPGWYRRELTVGREFEGKKIFLFFEGANQVASVYVNGQKAGSHIGGYTAFSFDITPFAKPGRNVIAVRVDNTFNENIPPLTADFNFYGGIYRDVWLIATSDVHFEVSDHASPGVQITTPNIANGDGTVEIRGIIVNQSDTTRDLELVTTIFDAANRIASTSASRASVDANRRNELQTRLAIPRPKLWSPESPYLYTVRISIREHGEIVDQITQPLGFRWYNFDGEKGFSLNGRPLKLRGTNRHQDFAGLGNALPDRLHVRDFELIKDAGFNFVRLAHYPQDPAVLEACDRLGLLVWEETPIVNYITKSHEFRENSERMVREMIRQHRNHPSVILWGYMNEIFLRVPEGRDDLYPATVELARDLNRIAKEEDPSRPTTIALHGNDIYNKTGLAEIPDVIGWNLYQGWYSATVADFGKFLDDQHRRFPKRPLIVSEYGANGDQRLHSDAPRRFDSTIEYQRYFHESYWQQIRARPYLSGSAIWSEFDFGSEFRGETIPHLNQKGMFTSRRIPKDVHYFYKAQLLRSDVLHIAVRDEPKVVSRSAEQKIEVYSNLSEVELFLNGRSLGKKPVGNSKKESWTASLRAGANRLTARGTKGKTAVVDSASLTFELITVKSNEVAINVGSNANFTDKDGRVWLADQPYSAGSWGYLGEGAKQIYSATTDRNVIGTEEDPLFQTMVEGLSEYKFDVPDGDYEVELLFAETKNVLPGKRVFDIAINGHRVFGNVDLAATVGRDHAEIKNVITGVTGGLSITFRATVGQPVLSGVRILKRAFAPRPF
jgi:beta-galactosidase